MTQSHLFARQPPDTRHHPATAGHVSLQSIGETHDSNAMPHATAWQRSRLHQRCADVAKSTPPAAATLQYAASERTSVQTIAELSANRIKKHILAMSKSLAASSTKVLPRTGPAMHRSIAA